MPKKSKSTKKSPGRLDKVIKKLNLARPRNQFIAAFLVVGVLGGGYFAYQSFAATEIRVATYSIANNNLYGEKQNMNVAGTATIVNSDSTKNSIKVLRLDGPMFAQTKNRPIISNSKVYQTCARVRLVSGPGAWIDIFGPGKVNMGGQTKYLTSKSYVILCNQSGSGSLDHGQLATLVSPNNLGTVIDVAQVYTNEISPL